MPLFKKKEVIDAASITVDDVLLQALLNGGNIDRDGALNLPIVSTAVNRIANTFASVPIKLYKEEYDDNGKRRVKEIFGDTRVFLLNDETGDTLNGFEMKRALCEDYLLGKGGWLYVERRRNDVKALYYVKDGKISLTKNNDPIKKTYQVEVNGKVYRPSDFLRILRDTRDGYTSKSLISEISKAVSAAFEALCFELKLSQTGGVKKGFITSENRLTTEAIDLLKSAWSRMYSDNSENVVVLNQGISFKEASQTPMEMQLNEIRSSLNGEISKAFALADTFNDFFRDAVAPILREFECSLNRDLLLETEKADGYFFAADTKELVKESLQDRYNAYRTGIDGGFLTVNEVRYEENRPEIEGQNVLKSSLGSVFYDIDSGEYYVPNTDGGTTERSE